MSIRLLATELYRAQKLVEQLEAKLEQVQLKDKTEIREELRVARAAHDKIRKMLDGAKAPSPFHSSTPKHRGGR